MSTTVTPVLSDKLYDGLKQVAQVILPGLGALYFGLAQIWGLPYAEEVVGTLAVVDVFLGLLLSLSTKRYNESDAKYDGALVVDSEDPAKDVYSFEIGGDLDKLRDKQTLTIKVVDPT